MQRILARLVLAGPVLVACAAGGPPAQPDPAAAAPSGAASLIETTFVGQVEPAPDHGRATVIVSTATEEVIVAPGPVARALRGLAGRQVRLRGWIVDRPQEGLVMVVSSFEVAGERHGAR